MAILQAENMDSQIMLESIGFLDNCFDNSFTLQNSLLAVKEYVNENRIEYACENIPTKKISCSLRASDSFICSSIAPIYQIKDQTIKYLKNWGLPSVITRKYEQRGIIEMFDWQVNCLSNPKILFDCSNLVYSAPTSAGKTLVAEILTIKTVLEHQKKVIIILPFVSIVREKMFYFQDILSSSGIRVEGFMGSQSPPGGLQAVHIAICTIEKANSLINRLLDDGNISELGAVVVDELHLLGDSHRGYILELLLTKIKYISMKSDSEKIQIIGMSATLPNLEVLAEWLNAELFVTKFRPIPLDEYCLVGNKYYNKWGSCIGTLDSFNSIDCDDCDCILKVCLETIKAGCSVLIFCMTKNRCENLATSMATSFFKLGCLGGKMGTVLRNELKSENISEVLEQLRNCPVGLDQVLKKTVSFGVAYHHAGLTFDERDIIEGGFKSGAIRVLVATSTLSSGVNLPARKVIIRSPIFQRQPLNILTYKQMVGRAGRMGKDTKGESILICTEAEKKIGFELMMGVLDPVNSCIESEDKYMRAVLEMIASQVLCTKEELDLYSKCTLLYTQQKVTLTQNSLLEKTLEDLRSFELIRIQSDENETRYVATPLGKACLSSSLAPNDGLSLFCELQRARQCLVLETDLHLLYLVTPYSVSSQWGDIDWLHLLTMWESLTKAMKRVGELVGIQESFIIRCLRGSNTNNNSDSKLNIHKRFYTALALQDLVNEVPLSEVAMKFQCARGFLQSLQQAAATFAGMVTAFCRQLGWKNMEMLISQFQDRLHFGIHSDLLELMKLPSLNGVRARTLFDSGYETVSSIATADSNVIESLLHKSIPFESEKEREGDHSDDIRKRNKLKNIWITGYCGITAKDAARNLIIEARKYLELEIGVTEIKWNDKIIAPVSADIMNKDEAVINSSNQMFLHFNQHANDSSSVNNYANGSSAIKDELLSQTNKSDFNKSTIFFENCVESNVNSNNNLLIASSNPVHSLECKSLEKKKILPEILDNNNKQISTVGEAYCYFSHSHQSVKDDIQWDTLSFTDTVIGDITKVRCDQAGEFNNMVYDEIVQSNTSDNTTSSKYNSCKDISLFSSEGDNSSIFDDSLPLELIPSKLFDDKKVSVMQYKGETINSADINFKTPKNNIKSTVIEIDDDEDIKLIYEEDHQTLEQKKTLDNINDDDIIGTPELINKDEINVFKRAIENNTEVDLPLAKKKKSVSLLKKHILPTCFLLNDVNSKTTVLEIKNFTIKCYLLKYSDVLDNLHLIENKKKIAICLDVRENGFCCNDVIGTNVLKERKHKESSVNCSPLIGVSFYLDNSTSVYLELCYSHSIFVSIKNRLGLLLKSKRVKLIMMSSKINYFLLKRWLDINVNTPCHDISLIEWLLHSDQKIPSLNDLTKKYCDVDLSTTPMKVGNHFKTNQNLDNFEKNCIKVWSIGMIAENQDKYLTGCQKIIDVETQVSRILADCEYQGILVDKVLASQLLIDVQNSQEVLQKKAYKLCGYHFNFNSSKDVAKVLGIYNGRKVSTKKSVLTSHNSVMSSIVIYWRKLNSILTKTLYPLTEKACIYSADDRINPSYTIYTCTGRISMHEPNLQNVPRTFSIPAHYLSLENTTSEDVMEFNCRNIFKAAPGCVIVSADYCQLEMRILTHYSRDSVLVNIMRPNTDVFKSIAATWSNQSEAQVDDDLRQKAKQLSYGIIYGMGNKTLGQHLDVSEMEAAVFMDSFYKTYPAVKTFTQSIIEDCKRNGYVETLMKRRRHLPDINSYNTSKRNAAERQAVNTMIQGSAADIAKSAMCAIDTETNSYAVKPRLILQMHDELIYEVLESDKQSFIAIIKRVMENTIQLNVPLPVKVRTGNTWGALKELTK